MTNEANHPINRPGLGEAEDSEEPPAKIRPVPMRVKVGVPIALYLVAVLSITYQSRSLMTTTLVDTADSINKLAMAISRLLTNHVMIYETYLTSRDLNEERHDWRQLASILRSSPGVSKVSLAGEISMHYNPGPRPTLDDILILLHDVSLPRSERGPGLSIDEGRTLRKQDEVVVSRGLLDHHGKKIGDEISLLGIRLRIVGVSNIDMNPPIPVILLDWSHIDEIVTYADQMAEAYNLTWSEDQDWFHSSANLVVYAKGFWNVDRAVEAIVEAQEIMWGECNQGGG